MTVTIRNGDCREILKTLSDESVHCVVTSPPYWGLRDYGVAGQLGLEQSPQEYVEQMVAVSREVRRVLRDDGTVWLNLGDTYAGYHGNKNSEIPTSATNGWTNGTNENLRSSAIGRVGKSGNKGNQASDGIGRNVGLKPKDLIGIPWRVAFALQADGWYLRQDIIWSKPNPMPESVTDRCTKAHEYIFLLSKSARYYYDADAIAEPALDSSLARYAYAGTDTRINKAGRYKDAFDAKDKFIGLLTVPDNPQTRNKRSVWEVATAPFSEAHFATFPPALIEPCILAGCPEKCCAKCGAPWLHSTEYGRVLSTGGSDKGMRAQNMKGYDPSGTHSVDSAYNTGNMVQREKITTGFSPSCPCNADTVAGAVLDPFGGAGTTGLVADRLGRNAILIELNPEYAAMAKRRLEKDAGMFASVSA